MVRILLVEFVWLNLQFSVSWQVDFQGGLCGSIFSLLCHGRQNFSGVHVAQSLVFCVMVGRFQWGSCGSIFCFRCQVWRLLVGFVWLNLQFTVSWLVDFQWGSCGSIFSFLGQGWRLLVGFVWLILYFSVSWLVDFQWGSCGSIFRFLYHDWWTFSGVRVAQSSVFCVMVGRLSVGFVCLNLQFSVSWLVDFQWVSCGSIFIFLRHGWQTFSGVRVAQTLVFCVMVRILLVGFVCLNLQFSASWLGDFQWGSCGSNFSFLCHVRQTFSGVRVAQSLVFCVMVGILLVGFVRLNLQVSGSRLATFSGVRVAQSLLFCLMVGRLLVGSCGPIFIFLCHDWWTFSGVRVAQSFVFCVMVGRLLVVFVRLYLQFSVSWLVDFQWASCVSIFRFLCHGRQNFSGVRVAQSLGFCVTVDRLLVGFVCLNLQFSVLWQVDFQWGSWGSIFRFLCHVRQTFSGFCVAQSLIFCVMVGRLLVGFVCLNLQFSVSWQVYFQWSSCGSIFSFLCHGWQTFSGVRVALFLVFCVIVGRFLVRFVWLNLQISVSCQVDFEWGSCVSFFSILCHGWQTFSGVRAAQSLVFCVMVDRFLVRFVWFHLQFSASWFAYFQWSSCGSIFSFLCHGRQTFRGVCVAQSLVFCVMVGRILVGFMWLNLQFSVSWLVDFSGVRVAQSLVFCVMVGRLLVGFVRLNLQFSVSSLATFSGVRVAKSLVYCLMVGRLLVGFVRLYFQFSVLLQVDFQ